MIITVLVVVGLCLGSFVNALVWRTHLAMDTSKKKGSARYSILTGRSMCPHCQHELAARDLVPVLSWLALRGKCRYCGKAIPDTPLAELLVPLLFTLSYAFWPYPLDGAAHIGLFILWLLCLVAFVALALYDLRWFILPDRIVWPLVLFSALFRLRLALDHPGGHSAVSVLLGGLWGVLLLAGLFYILFAVSSERWIGGGDVKLAIALGLLAGGPLGVLVVLFVASTAGTLASVPLMARKRSLQGIRVPFGPFLILGAIIAVLWGSSITDWYGGLFTP